MLQNPENPSCIDLILTNLPQSFQGSYVVETVLSDFHRIVVTIMKTTFHRMVIIIMKTTFQRLPSKIRTYRNHNKFYNHKFGETLVKELSSSKIWNNDISIFIDICVRNLDKHESLRKKYVRGNHLPFINKELPKAIIHWSKLRNNFLPHRSN